MREEIVEPFFQPVWISVWLLYVKRGTVFFALCSTFRRVILFPCSLAEGKTAHSCFAVGGIAPSRRLNARDLIFQELIKSDCDLQTWFQSRDGRIHSECALPCDSPSSSPNPSCFTVGVKPGQAYMVAHGKMFWKEQVGGRWVRSSSLT